MARRSTRKRKPPEKFVATAVRVTGRRITKPKLSVQDLNVWEQINVHRHGNSLNERAIRAETKRRISPLIEETLRQQDVTRKYQLENHRLKKQLRFRSMTLEQARNRIDDLSHKLRSCRKELSQVGTEIKDVRKNLDHARYKLSKVDSSRDRVARRLIASAKKNEAEKVCLFCLIC